MKTPLKIVLLATTMLVSMGSAFAQTDEKQIQVRQNATENLAVSVTPASDTYQPNEAIQFNISGNKDFFLYLFSVDSDNKNATMIFPNADHQGNKFTAGHHNVIPNNSVEFFSDSVGMEKVIAIASTRYFDWDTNGYTAVGKFMQVDTATFEQQTKAFRVRSRREAAEPVAEPSVAAESESGIFIQTETAQVQEVMVQIAGASVATLSQRVQQQVESTVPTLEIPVAETPATTIVFSGTDKKVYKDGDRVEILVGANEPGMLHLFTAEPNGRLVFLTKQAVDGKGFNTIQAEATAPYGVHAIVVAYSTDATIDKNYLIDQFEKEALAGQSKGLRLIEKPEPIAYSVTQFRIEN